MLKTSSKLAKRIAPQYRPSVAQTPVVPDFSKDAGIEEVADTLQDLWQSRCDEPRSVIGLIVEKDWKPSSEWDASLNIADAILDAGGMPKLMFEGEKSVSEQMVGINGLAIPGGRDVDPTRYGQVAGPGMSDSVTRPSFDDFEIEAIQAAFSTGMPMLGHCRGHQIMNVAGGGTLIQDLPTEHEPEPGSGSKYGVKVNHRPQASLEDQQERIHEAHLIVVEPGSRLGEVAGDELEAVNSIHHQAVDQVSPLMEVVARAPDGVIEGLQRKDMPWQSSYQFHPESQRYTDPKFQLLYDQLVDDGAQFREGVLGLG